MAIFDGKELVFEESDWFIINFFRLLWRYGFSFLRMQMWVESILDKFMRWDLFFFFGLPKMILSGWNSASQLPSLFSQNLPVSAVWLLLHYGGEAPACYGRWRLSHSSKSDSGGNHERRRVFTGLHQRNSFTHHSCQLWPKCPHQWLCGYVSSASSVKGGKKMHFRWS